MQQRAFEFVAAWFGFPYDAVNVRLTAGQVLSWGFWGFTIELYLGLEYDGAGTAQCVAVWKVKAVVHGIDGGENLDDVRDWIRNS